MIGDNLIILEKVDSSNLYLSKLLTESKIDEGTAIFAREQTKGRGQLNNRWESDKNKNILLSFVVYPEFLKIERQFLLAKFVSLGVKTFLDKYLNNVKIKWPNDIYINDKKIAGILIENTLRLTKINNSIIGIGINVNQELFSRLVLNPTSMKIESGKIFDVEKLLDELFEQMNTWYEYLISMRYAEVDRRYLASLYQFGNMANYHDKEGDFNATITGVDENGYLCLIDINNNLRKYAFKEVVFGSSAP